MEAKLKQMLQDVRTAIDIALSEVEEAHGFSIELGVFTWDAYSKKFTCRLTAHKISGDDPHEIERREWEANCLKFGLGKEDFHRVILVNGDQYRLEAIKPRRPKYPIIARNLDSGGMFKFPELSVHMAIKREAS